MKEIHIIAGPNGAGKTTLIHTFAKNPNKERDIKIAPNPDDPAIDAHPITKQKIMVQYIRDCLAKNDSVIFETTGSGRNSILGIMNEARSRGYKIAFWFLFLPNIQVSMGRVSSRVREGGHFVPPSEIENRYNKGIENLHFYFENADQFVIIDRSRGKSGRLVAFKRRRGLSVCVSNENVWSFLCSKNKNLESFSRMGKGEERCRLIS